MVKSWTPDSAFDEGTSLLASEDVRWEDLVELPMRDSKIGRMLRALAVEWSAGALNRLYGDQAPRIGTVYAHRDKQNTLWISFSPRHSASAPGWQPKTASQSVVLFRGPMIHIYSYDRTAAKPKTTEKEKPAKSEPSSRTDGTKKSEVTRAMKTIEIAIDAIHDCAPSARDYQEEGDYDSKAYSKAVADHGKRIDALHDIANDLSKLQGTAKTAAETRMRSGMWYVQTFGSGETIWFLADREQKNEGFAGKKVEWRGRNPKVIKTSVPKSFWSLWKETPKSEIPPEVLEAV